jgi:outer membrane biogenesis lipoprotein LolB
MALALSACALTPEPRGPLPDLRSVPAAFEMSGRIAVRQGERNDIARLRWTHRPSGDEWVIATPLGNEVARIASNASGATLEHGSETERAASFGALAESLLGVRLEPEQLASWLHASDGVVPPSDWTVTLDERQAAGSITIARRMSASRGDVSLRLVVDDYKVLEP